MTTTIKKIIDKLKKYPEAEYNLTDNSIVIKPKNDSGFPVTLTSNGYNHYTVSFDFWHEEFTKEEDALNCFVFGLSQECRLKLTKRGNKPYKWTVEFKDSETWKEDSTTGLFNLTLWRRKTIEYLQNDFIKNE